MRTFAKTHPARNTYAWSLVWGLGTFVSLPSYAAREFLNSLVVAFLFIALLLTGLYLLGASAGEETDQSKTKLSVVPKFRRHANSRLSKLGNGFVIRTQSMRTTQQKGIDKHA
jgi:hypothetical protein